MLFIFNLYYVFSPSENSQLRLVNAFFAGALLVVIIIDLFRIGNE